MVFGYWDQILGDDVDRLQDRINQDLAAIAVPVLGVFGHTLSEGERSFLTEHITAPLELVEEDGAGHFVHLARPDAFIDTLEHFIERSSAHTGRNTLDPTNSER